MEKREHSSEEVERRTELRNVVSSVFVGVLIAIAFEQMIEPVRASIRGNGFTLGVIVLAVVFFLTSMRFFIGNQLHLLSGDLIRMKGDVWFFDFIVIVLQTTLLVFLGGVTSVKESLTASIGFAEILIFLYSVDVLWIVSQWLLGKIWPSWKRNFIPWAWAILNSLLTFSMLTLRALTGSFYNNDSLMLLGVLNTAAFLVDVWLVDYYDLI